MYKMEKPKIKSMIQHCFKCKNCFCTIYSSSSISTIILKVLLDPGLVDWTGLVSSPESMMSSSSLCFWSQWSACWLAEMAGPLSGSSMSESFSLSLRLSVPLKAAESTASSPPDPSSLWNQQDQWSCLHALVTKMNAFRCSVIFKINHK